MEEVWKSLPVAGPVGVVLVIVVVAFLRHLSAMDKLNREERAEDRKERQSLGARIDNLVDGQLEQSTEAMNRVSEAIREQGRQCQQMRDFVAKMAQE